jgi:hypothetical protein
MTQAGAMCFALWLNLTSRGQTLWRWLVRPAHGRDWTAVFGTRLHRRCTGLVARRDGVQLTAARPLWR